MLMKRLTSLKELMSMLCPKPILSLSELTYVIGNIATDAIRSGLDMKSHHVPFSDASRRVNRIIYG